MNLENLNLVELNAQEVKETEGGCPHCMLVQAYNWVSHQASDFWNGVKSGL